MANLLIPRDRVHAWTDEFITKKATHAPKMQLLLGRQRVLGRYVKKAVKGIDIRQGAILRTLSACIYMFDLSGGELGVVGEEELRAGEAVVSAGAGLVLPADTGLPERLRELVPDRAQGHLIDELLLDIFPDPEDEEAPGDHLELFKAFLVLWVAVEALDRVWTPPADFDGPSRYKFTPVE